MEKSNSEISKRNPRGAGRKPRSIEAERTSISIEKDLKSIAKKHFRNITADVNEGMRIIYQQKGWV